MDEKLINDLWSWVINMSSRASFPLFQMLYDKISVSEFTGEDIVISPEEQDTICSMIRGMNDYQHELVYAIIRCYQLQVDGRSIFENPYNSKRVRNNQFRFDLSNLPIPLQRILLLFIDIHDK